MRAEDINSLESESGVIASLIHHPEFIYYSEHLLPGHFTNRENGCMYAAIQRLVGNEIFRIDAFNIIEALNSTEATRRLAEALQVEKVNEFIELSDVLCRETVEEYKLLVANVLDAAFRRDTVRRLRACEELCFNRAEENIEQRIYELIDDVMSEFSVADDVPVFGDVLDEVWDEIVRHQDGHDSGAPFKFPTLNEYVTIEPGELVVLAAPAKGAKSMFMLNTAVDLLRQGKKVMYIDSELSTRLFTCRLISNLTGIEFVRVRSGRYSPEEADRIKQAREWLRRLPFVHIYMPIFDRQAIYTAVKKVFHRFDPLDILIVDYLKSTGDTDAYATYAELGKLTDTIKNDIAGSMGIAAIAAAQLTDSGRLADSAKIARNASTILLLTDKDPEEIERDGPNCGNKKLVVSKNRNGMQHVSGEWIDLNFHGNTCLLEEATQHIPDDPY